MDLSSILQNEISCSCGRRHQAGIRKYAYQSGVIEQLPEIISKVSDSAVSRCAVVADQRTWRVCGQQVADTLSKSGTVMSVLLEDTHGTPVCNQETANGLKQRLSETSVELVVAVGSGVVNDLCKWVSFDLDLPYLIVATAASMNGYSAANVAPMVDGVKVLVRARPPLAVLAEPEVIENAPYELTSAGFGDTIAKFQSNADWLINHFLFDEYYCSWCASLVDDLEGQFLRNPDDIYRRKPAAIEGLFEALFRSGLAMTLVGTSAPASGGEHLLSHTLDMASFVRHKEHDLHGRQVGIGVILSAVLYERMMQVESPEFRDVPSDIDEQYWRQPVVIQAVRQQYRDKQPAYQQARKILSNSERWDRLRSVLGAKLKAPQQVRQWLRQARAACTPEDIGWSPEQLQAAADHAHEIRKRYTIVDLAMQLGLMPARVDEWLDA